MEMEGIISLLFIVLGVLGAVFGMAGAYLSSSRVFRRVEAEKELARNIVIVYQMERQIEELKKIRNVVFHEGKVDDELLGRYVVHVGKALKMMEGTNRELLIGALEQPSKRGRRAYIEKLIREASPEAKAV